MNQKVCILDEPLKVENKNSIKYIKKKNKENKKKKKEKKKKVKEMFIQFISLQKHLHNNQKFKDQSHIH